MKEFVGKVDCEPSWNELYYSDMLTDTLIKQLCDMGDIIRFYQKGNQKVCPLCKCKGECDK